MAWTSPRTWVDGELVTASLMNTHVRDNLTELRVGNLSVVEVIESGSGPFHNYAAAGNVLIFTGSGDKLLTGIVAPSGTTGSHRIVVMNGPGTLRLAHEDTGSEASNRISTTSTRGQILGQDARVVLVYGPGANRWRVVSVDPGGPIAVPYNSANFTADAGTWTVEAGDVVRFHYVQRGRVVHLDICLLGTSTSGVGSELRVALPNGFVGAAQSWAGARAFAGGAKTVFLRSQPNVSYVGFLETTGAAWPDSSNVHVGGQLEMLVN